MSNSRTIRQDFPIFTTEVNGKPLTYLDSAATSQKPQVVIDAITEYYKTSNANVHRGVHTLSDISTVAWEKARQKIASFLGAKDAELIITRNTTEAINLVALGWARHQLKPGDVILVSLMEHHANLVPWQEVARQTEAELRIIPVTPDGLLDWQKFESLVDNRVKLIAVTQVSNALGTLINIPKVVSLAKKVGAKVLVDGAQAAAHIPVNFSELDVDFYACSAHKMLGPMGIGALLVRQELLDSNEFKPVFFGGGMISAVYVDQTEYHEDPRERFTAGTPDVASAVGWAAALDYLDTTVGGMARAAASDAELLDYCYTNLRKLKNVTIVGPTPRDLSEIVQRVGSVSFIYRGAHAHDVAQVLDSQGVAVRSGHHCTMPLHTHFGWQATLRASFHVYSSKQDVDILIEALKKVPTALGLSGS